MCNLGEGIYERAVAEKQARQAIETEKLLKKMKSDKEAEIKEELENKAKKLIATGLNPNTVKRIMES